MPEHKEVDPFTGVRQMLKVAVYIFCSFATAMIVGGIIMVFDDPAGFYLIGFGIVFGGLPLFVYRQMRIPDGKKAIVMGSSHLEVAGHSSNQTSFLIVDEGTSDTEIAALKSDNLKSHWQKREDWRSGRIVEEQARKASLLSQVAVVWTLLLIVMVALGWTVDSFFYFMGAVLAVVIIIMVCIHIRLVLHRRKFGASEFLMNPCPVLIGGQLSGTVLTGIPVSYRYDEPFDVEVHCTQGYQVSTSTNGANDPGPRQASRQHTHWSHSTNTTGRSSAKRIGALEVKIEVPLPKDCPPTSMSDNRNSVVWQLVVRRKLPRLDYHARFIVPVLSAETVEQLDL